MASAEASSDSDPRNRHPPHVRSDYSDTRPVSAKVQNLASTLQDTNRNLRAMDRMLGEYRDLGDEHSSTVNKLQSELARASGEMRDERSEPRSRMRLSDLEPDYTRDEAEHRRHLPTSPLRDYEFEKTVSDREFSGFPDGRRRRHRPRAGVRFCDDMDTESHFHTLHQSIRDLDSGQRRMEVDLQSEIDRHNWCEYEQRRSRPTPAAASVPLRHTVSPSATLTGVASGVEQRLQSIQDELKLERDMFRQKSDEVGKISTELKQALQTQKAVPTLSQSGVGESRAAPTQAMSAVTMENELEKTRRKLDQSEGGRHALIEQIEQLRRLLHTSEDEKLKLRSRVQLLEMELRERRSTNTLSEQEQSSQTEERRRLEEEGREMRVQLARSASAMADYSGQRRELDESERQRAQLSDHIQALTRDVDEKERCGAKATLRLQAMTDRCEDVERERASLASQLDDARRRLADVTTSLDALRTDAGQTDTALRESERKRGEVKIRAQETVKQWKLKCRELERDVDRVRHQAAQTTTRNEQLVQQLGLSQSQQGSGVQHVDKLKHELTQFVAVRAQQDEHMRQVDIQLSDLKSLKIDMERDLRDSKIVIERMELELTSGRDRLATLTDEKCRLEDEVSMLHNSQMTLQNHMHQYQKEVKDYGLFKVEVANQMASAANEKQELKSQLRDLLQREASSKEDADSTIASLEEERGVQKKIMENMKRELDMYRENGSQKIKEICRKFKHQQAEKEAELQAIKLTIQEERSLMKLSKKHQRKLTDEVDMLNRELAISRENTNDIQQSYHKVKEDFITKSQITEAGLTQAKQVELELLDAKEMLIRNNKDYQNLLHTASASVDAVVEVAATGSLDSYKALSLSKGLQCDPPVLLAEIKSKLDWLKDALWERRKMGKWADVREGCGERRGRREAPSKQDGYGDVIHPAVVELSDKCKDEINLDIDSEQLVSDTDTRWLSGRLENTSTDVSRIISDTARERERIHNRYHRLQETMTSLRFDIADTRSLVNSFKEPGHSDEFAPTKRLKKVRISSPPTVKEGVATDTKSPGERHPHWRGRETSTSPSERSWNQSHDDSLSLLQELNASESPLADPEVSLRPLSRVA